MKRIYKFPVEIEDAQIVEVPKVWQWLSAQMQHGQLCLWAQVEDEGPREKWGVRIVGTGHPCTV